MQFQHTWEKVLSGEKTLTSRIVKPTEHLAHTFEYAYVWSVPTLRPKYQVGKTYAVQPGRGKATIGHIELLAIRQYDVREITEDEARREGFTSRTHFWLVWSKMHDPKLYDRYPTTGQLSLACETGVMASRLTERYTAWQLAFKLCAE